MITVKMKDGFEIEVNPTFVKDSEQLEELANKDQLSGLFYSCNCLLTAENKKRLYDHLRDENGIVPVDDLSNAMNELITSCPAGKNSASSPN